MNEHEITVSGGNTVRLKTAGKYCKVDILVTAEEGGGGGDDLLDALIEGTVTDVTSNASVVRSSAFSNMESIVSATLPNATSIGSSAFMSCTNLATVSVPKVETVAGSAFYGCSKLAQIDLAQAESIASQTFRTCGALKAVILRRTDSACTLGSSAFGGTPIASGTGYIYVPSALIDTYKAASNWSAYAAQFRALEDYTVDGTVTGALDASKI